MTVTVVSNAHAAEQGGGVLYAAAIAAALAGRGPVDLLFRAPVQRAALERALPFGLDGVRLGLARRLGRLDELRALASGCLVVQQSTEVPRLRSRRSFLLCELPAQRRLGPGDRLRLRAFRRVVANSFFIAGWIQRRWGRAADVLHPPIFPIPVREKLPRIVLVGRFSGSGRSKRQLEAVEVFRRLAADAPGWELHMVGFPEDAAYVERVRAAADGLPVTLHLGLPRAEVERVVGVAAIVWSATGLGADPETQPEMQEHFGIAVGEVMSAGAAPVVFAGGGPLEIVGDAGRIFATSEEWRTATLELIGDAELRGRLGERARERALGLGWQTFDSRARELFALEDGR